MMSVTSRYLSKRLGGNPGVNNYLFPADGFMQVAGACDIEAIAESWHHVHQPIALYVHVPFCPAHCRFCGFATTYGKGRDDVRRYLQGIRRELAAWNARVPLGQLPIGAVCIGGGTPNYLDSEEFTQLAETLREAFVIPTDIEWTVEIYPSRRLCGDDVLKAMIASGVNRISLAVQDFNDRVLREERRQYTANEAREIGRMIRQLGVRDMNVDLMVGLPDQDDDNAATNFAALEELLPETVTLNPYSDRARKIPLRRLFTVDGSWQRQLYEHYRGWLEQHGWTRENKSDFVRGKTFVYEDLVVRCYPRFGVGVNALSGTDTWAYRNYGENGNSLERYYAVVEGGRIPIERSFVLNDEMRLRRRVYYGMLNGATPLPKVPEWLTETLEALVAHGLATYDGAEACLTEDGIWNTGIVQKSLHPPEMLRRMLDRE